MHKSKQLQNVKQPIPLLSFAMIVLHVIKTLYHLTNPRVGDPDRQDYKNSCNCIAMRKGYAKGNNGKELYWILIKLLQERVKSMK